MLRHLIVVTLAGVAFALSFGVTGIARADVVAWDEAVNGEFSHNGLAPTSVTFVSGGNDILGTDGRPAAPTDPLNPDYFTFHVPAGLALTAITVLPGTMSAGPLMISFIGLEAGTQITLPTNATSAAGLLGWWHTAGLPNPNPDIGSDILSKMAIPAQGSSGFTPPLGAGDYAIWIEETGVCGANLCQYGYDFVLAAVPEPASGVVVLTGFAVLAMLRRHRRVRPPASAKA